MKDNYYFFITTTTTTAAAAAAACPPCKWAQDKEHHFKPTIIVNSLKRQYTSTNRMLNTFLIHLINSPVFWSWVGFREEHELEECSSCKFMAEPQTEMNWEVRLWTDPVHSLWPCKSHWKGLQWFKQALQKTPSQNSWARGVQPAPYHSVVFAAFRGNRKQLSALSTSFFESLWNCN